MTCLTHYKKLLHEVGEFQEELLEKPRLLIATKEDIEGTADNLLELRETYPELDIASISVFARTGIEEIKHKFFALARK